MTVKGSKQFRPVVVPYRPRYRLFLVVLITLLACALAGGSFMYGYQQARRDHERAMDEWNQVQELSHQQEIELQQLKQQAANSQVGSVVDRKAMDKLRQEIVDLNQQIADLTESNNFYRQLIDPNANLKGLTIGSWTVSSSGAARHYHYKLLIQQFTSDHHPVTGKITITISGKVAGQARSFALGELSPQTKSTEIPLKVRFYQAVEGEFVLPEGFDPEAVAVAVLRAGAESPLTQSYNWSVKN